MKRLAVVAVLVVGMPIVQAQEADFHAEVMEWVIEPCMEVAAALGVQSYDYEQVEMGIKRAHIAQVMTASRDSAAREISSKMKASATWEDRRGVYPIMLELCLTQVKKDAE